MWETHVICKACGETHLAGTEFIPRSFAFECPRTGERVDLRFHDPAQLPEQWVEVTSLSKETVPVLQASRHGNLDA